MSLSSKRGTAPSAVQLMEESVHLLRCAPSGTFVIYFAGCLPFVLGLLFFWARVTWFAPSTTIVASSALGLAGLFAVMKGAQAEFCGRLLAQRLGQPVAPFSAARWARMVAVQMRLQAWALVALPVALLLTLPFGWVYAYFQGVTVLGEDPETHDVALAQATLWPAQNHLGLLLLSVVSIFALGNLAAAFVAVPWLANRVLGIDNVFGFSGWWFANTTFLVSVLALTWLAVDPLAKAFYTLRVFHGRSRTTGEDLRVDLQLARRGSRALRSGLVALLLLACFLPGPASFAASAPAAATATVKPEDLQRSIHEVLAGPEFEWRLRPTHQETDDAGESTVKRFVRQVVETIAGVFRGIGRKLRQAMDWVSDLFPSGKSSPAEGVSGAGNSVRTSLYVLVAAAALLIALVILLLYRRGQTDAVGVVPARAVTTRAPDLQDEATQAAQLPADGWLALAREQLAQGEWRLALRALQLASLARLGAHGLISLAKFKTNLDYERELRRRALARGELVAQFAVRRSAFEAAWYGQAQPAESEIREWLSELERPL